jgi:uncharacterized tellurite resistance protein B-like protein
MSDVKGRIMVITDLLLGAAYADDEHRGSEEETVRKLLGELLGGEELPAEVDTRIKTFPSGSFDLEATAEDFANDPPIQKRKLLELVAAVHDADEELDFAEDAYLKKLGVALGLAPKDFADLTLDIEIEELKASFSELAGSVPPPVPDKA